MQVGLAMKSEFLTDLVIEELQEEGIWQLEEPLKYSSRLLNLIVEAPMGFKTDFSSVPRVPIAYTFFGDRAHRESVIHDWLYSTGSVSRRMADKVFLEAMKARKKPWWTRWSMFAGVRLGGWKAWGDHRKKD